MDEELPDDFDVIVVGTGLSESIFSSALSRIGKKVLHLDQNKHYGGSWSSFNLNAFESWLEDANSDKDSLNSDLDNFSDKLSPDTEDLILIKSIRKTITNGETACFLPYAKVQSVAENQSSESAAPHERETQDASDPESATTSQEPARMDEGGLAPTQSNSSMPNAMSDEDTESRKEGGCNVVEDQLNETSAPQGTTQQGGSLPSQEMEQPPPKDVPSVRESSEPTGVCDENSEDKDHENVIVEKIGEGCAILIKSPKVVDDVDKHTKEYFYSKWRHYNLDISPKLMFSRGKLVELLITSNVCRYLEFRNVTRTLTLLAEGGEAPKKLAPVPCSRTDVFTSKFIGMIEKRMLMRVLTICANFENHPQEYEEFKDRPFVDFLASKKLSKKLQQFIMHSIAMVPEDTDTLKGLQATQKFLNSLGRYGNSAFLWPLYGVGELPQAFCRLGAVFGGTFCLNRFLKAIITDKADGKCVAIVDSTGRRINCRHLILDERHTPESCRIPFAKTIARAIYITDSTVLPADGDKVSLITIPPMAELQASRFIEVGSSCCVCPSKYYVVHGITNVKVNEGESAPSPRSQFSKTEEVLFNDIELQERSKREDRSTHRDNNGSESSAVAETENTKPNVLWMAHFNVNSDGVNGISLPENVHIMKGPDMELGFDNAVLEARQLFETVCPEEEFLPRAPNPDEIIYFDQDDEGYNTETNGANAARQPEATGEYQEDESDCDAGTGEPTDQEEAPSSNTS